MCLSCEGKVEATSAFLLGWGRLFVVLDQGIACPPLSPWPWGKSPPLPPLLLHPSGLGLAHAGLEPGLRLLGSSLHIPSQQRAVGQGFPLPPCNQHWNLKEEGVSSDPWGGGVGCVQMLLWC